MLVYGDELHCLAELNLAQVVFTIARYVINLNQSLMAHSYLFEDGSFDASFVEEVLNSSISHCFLYQVRVTFSQNSMNFDSFKKGGSSVIETRGLASADLLYHGVS